MTINITKIDFGDHWQVVDANYHTAIIVVFTVIDPDVDGAVLAERAEVQFEI